MGAIEVEEEDIDVKLHLNEMEDPINLSLVSEDIGNLLLKI